MKLTTRETMVIISAAVLPYQKKRLAELADSTRKSQSELVREALTLLFAGYRREG